MSDGTSLGDWGGRQAARGLKFAFSCLWLIHKGDPRPFIFLSDVISVVPVSVGFELNFAL